MSKDSEFRSLDKVTDYVEDKVHDNQNVNNVSIYLWVSHYKI